MRSVEEDGLVCFRACCSGYRQVDRPIRHDVSPVDTNGTLDRRLQAACDGAAEIVRRSLGRVSVAELMRKGR